MNTKCRLIIVVSELTMSCQGARGYVWARFCLKLYPECIMTGRWCAAVGGMPMLRARRARVSLLLNTRSDLLCFTPASRLREIEISFRHRAQESNISMTYGSWLTLLLNILWKLWRKTCVYTRVENKYPKKTFKIICHILFYYYIILFASNNLKKCYFLFMYQSYSIFSKFNI